MVELKRKKPLKKLMIFACNRSHVSGIPGLCCIRPENIQNHREILVKLPFGNYRELTNNCVKSYHQVLKPNISKDAENTELTE